MRTTLGRRLEELRLTEDNDESHGIVPASTPLETGFEVAAVVTSAVPWIGGPVSAVLSGVSFGRKMDRVREALTDLTAELEGFETQASTDYVRTEDFEDLLERTLRQVADERTREKRHIYALFLAGAIKTPGEAYDEQLRFLRTLEELQPDHLRVLHALSLPPEGGSGWAGSQLQTLRNRLPEMEEGRIQDLVSQLNDMRVTNLTSLKTLMTFEGSQDMHHSVTPYGSRLLSYIQAG